MLLANKSGLSLITIVLYCNMTISCIYFSIKLTKNIEIIYLFFIQEDPAMFESWAMQCADLLEKTTNSESINYLGKQVDHMTDKLNPM